MTVYAMFFPNNKVYIGVTKRPLNLRIKEHVYLALTKNKNSKLYNAIRKYINEKIYYAKISSASSVEELYNLEKEWIKVYDSFNQGLNSNEGGIGGLGKKHSIETISKIKNNIPKRSKEFYINIASKWRKENLSKEDREKRSIACGGKKFSVKDITGNIVGSWISIEMCAEDLNLNPKGIHKVLKGYNKMYKGFIFYYDS